MRSIRVCEIKRGENFPMSKSWVYKMAHLHKYPNLLFKVGAALFVDLDRFQELMEKGRLR